MGDAFVANPRIQRLYISWVLAVGGTVYSFLEGMTIGAHHQNQYLVVVVLVLFKVRMNVCMSTSLKRDNRACFPFPSGLC
jgi:hypothetical protein